MSGMTVEQARALRAVATVVIDTVRQAGPLGAPGGVMYAAMMGAGCSLHQFDQIMSGLTRAGMLSKRGECYHLPEVQS